MSGAILVHQIRYGSSRSDKTELSGMLRLEQSGMKTSREKRGISERSEKITQREKSLDKKKKISVRRSEQRVRKVVWSRAKQAV